MMRIAVAMVAALLCAAGSVSAFVVPVSRPCAGVRHGAVASRTVRPGFSRRAVAPLSMSSVALPPSPTSAATKEPRPNVQPIRSHDEFLSTKAQHQDKLVVVKFYDQFCRACDEIRPRFENLSQASEDQNAAFFEVEFSASKDLCKQLGIKVLPTVQIYSGADGRVADLPAGPSRFDQVEMRFAEVMGSKASSGAGAVVE